MMCMIPGSDASLQANRCGQAGSKEVSKELRGGRAPAPGQVLKLIYAQEKVRVVCNVTTKV
jgi:hypothetical protein